MSKQRILYVDYFKAMAIILVIAAHVNFANGCIKPWITSFVMPAFFFSSGLVLRSGSDISLKDTLINKLQRLMLPYVLWAVFYARFSFPNLLKIFYGSSVSITSSSSLSSLWFLPVMFTALVFFYLFVKIGLANRQIYKILLMIVAFTMGSLLPNLKVGYPWGADVAVTSFAFILLGNICQGYVGRLYMHFKANRSVGLTISFLLFLLMFACTFAYQLNDIPGGVIQMKCARYGNYGLFVLTGVVGTFMLLFLNIAIELLNERGFKWLQFIGQNTLVIFAVHKPWISFFRIIFSHVPAPDVVSLLLTTVPVLIISCLICSFVNKYAPVLAGR